MLHKLKLRIFQDNAMEKNISDDTKKISFCKKKEENIIIQKKIETGFLKIKDHYQKASRNPLSPL